jgi:DNA-binding transcriptional MerR regulator
VVGGDEGRLAAILNDLNSGSQEIEFADAGGAGPPPQPKVVHKVNVNHRIFDADEGGKDEDDDDAEVWAALEEACRNLGLSPEQIKDMLEDEAGFPPAQVMEEVLRSLQAAGKSATSGRVKSVLNKQRAAVLDNVKRSLLESKKLNSDQEKKMQTALRAMGPCPMGFDWIKKQGGWRCAGGSHFVTDDQLEQYMLGV